MLVDTTKLACRSLFAASSPISRGNKPSRAKSIRLTREVSTARDQWVQRKVGAGRFFSYSDCFASAHLMTVPSADHDGFFSKPYEREEIVDVIKTLLDQKNADEQ